MPRIQQQQWIGSPSSPTNASAQRPQNPYLPPFLMGESSYAASNTATMRPFNQVASPAPVRSSQNSTPLNQSINNSYSNYAKTSFYQKDVENNRSMRRRNGPPPVKTLEESLSTGPSNRMNDFSDASLGPLSMSGHITRQRSKSGTFGNQSCIRDPLSTNVASPFCNNSKMMSPSPAQLDPFYTQGESLNIGDELDETWVTVFGFPKSTESFILQEFSSFGTIVNHVMPQDGNWMHIQFQNKLQAKRAIGKSGKVFGGRIMVGVMQCIDKSMMDNKKTRLRASSSQGNLMNKSLCNSSALDVCNSSRKQTPIRSLTSPYTTASNEHQVIRPTQVPQKSSGIVAKAMEYLLGW